METWLNIAEKPSVAKELANVLSRNSYQTSRSLSRFNPVFNFELTLQSGKNVFMVVTSVAGHLMELEFSQEYRSWNVPVGSLLRTSCKTIKQVPNNFTDLKKNIEMLAKKATKIVLWLDCDREGENIAFEVISVARASNPRLTFGRAIFSALTSRDLVRALNSLQEPNRLLSEAVDTRQELDLRIGAAFTRFQTKRFGQKYNNMPKVVSFGPCQFPTLGFVVRRYWEREGFIPEQFYEARMTNNETVFTWTRGAVYDLLSSTVLIEEMLHCSLGEGQLARIISVDNKPSRRNPPHPLATVALQKAASRFLHISSEQTMTLAEKLYQEGFISYPRTETDSFSYNDEELREYAQLFAQSSRYSSYVEKLLMGDMYNRPSSGGHNDNAHPPVHPTKLLETPEVSRDPKHALYDLIVRTFLACISKSAVGASTTVRAVLGGEIFSTSGLTVLERNWLEIYPFERWSSSKEVPSYKVGDQFTPTSVYLYEGRTEAPQLLSEAQLINQMDKHGIGTDATIAQHIKTIQDRGYVLINQGRFVPTSLGLALIAAYVEFGFEELSLPQLRAQMELSMSDIASGNARKEAVIEVTLNKYFAILEAVSNNASRMGDCLGRYLQVVVHNNESDLRVDDDIDDF